MSARAAGAKSALTMSPNTQIRGRMAAKMAENR
jgi:hypothetical protein